MIRYNLFITLLVITLSGFGQQTLSLDDAICIALGNNYDIEIFKQNEQIASINNSWGAAGRYPYVNLSLESRNNINENQTEDYKQQQYVGNASVNWTLFDGFSVRINKQRLEELEKLSEQNTGIMIESTIQSVVMAYYSVLLEKEKLSAYQEVMNLSEDLYKRMLARQDFGTAVTYDVLQTQNAFLADKSAFLIQEVACKNALRNLNYLMAVTDNPDYQFTGKLSAIPVEYTFDELSGQMIANNKSLKNQYLNQNLLKHQAALARSNFYPSVSFSGGITGTRTGTDYETRTISWGNTANFYGNLTLSFNLFSGGNRKRALQIAEIDQEIGKVELNQMTHELNNQLANIFEYYLVRKELLNVAAENLSTAKLNLKISREKFESGAINSFNFRDVQNLYLSAAIHELEAIYNFIDTHTSLLRMTGSIIQQYQSE